MFIIVQVKLALTLQRHLKRKNTSERKLLQHILRSGECGNVKLACRKREYTHQIYPHIQICFTECFSPKKFVDAQHLVDIWRKLNTLYLRISDCLSSR